MRQKKATNKQVIDAYTEHGSCRKAAGELGMCAQSIHERLVKIGAINKRNIFTSADKERLTECYQVYADTGKVQQLADEMGRTRQFLCRKAKALGLTDPYRGRSYLIEMMRVRHTEWHKNNPHPKGMLGKKHTRKTKAIISITSIKRWADLSESERAAQVLKSMRTRERNGTLTPPRHKVSWKAGWREIGGYKKYYRSSWEANYARYLQWLKELGEIKAWEHEPDTFWFDEVKRGCRSYLPDFKVTENNNEIAYHEVKGWMDDRSKTKIKRMKKYHPDVVLIIIDSKVYKSIARKVSSMIAGWE